MTSEGWPYSLVDQLYGETLDESITRKGLFCRVFPPLAVRSCFDNENFPLSSIAPPLPFRPAHVIIFTLPTPAKYNIHPCCGIGNQTEYAEDFARLGLADQKRFSLEVLDKNQHYVNFSEIDDIDHRVSEQDKRLNWQFYGA
jgi:hypothetical protein